MARVKETENEDIQVEITNKDIDFSSIIDEVKEIDRKVVEIEKKVEELSESVKVDETETANGEAAETAEALKDDKIVDETEKFKLIMDVTIRNYSNMIRRLSHKKDFANNVIIYYSIALIVYSLTAKYFPNYYGENMSSYVSIILSVVILVYSIINGNANYSKRLEGLDNALNEVKIIKRDLTTENRKDMKIKYDKVVNHAEYREDVDFFLTARQLCMEEGRNWLFYRKFDDETKPKNNNGKSKYSGKKLKNYFSELNHPLFVWNSIVINWLIKAILVVLPIALFVMCVMLKNILG